MSLESALRESKFGMCVVWSGRSKAPFYNEAFRPLLVAGAHPTELAPFIEQAMSGESVAREDFPLRLNRHGIVEDCYLTFSCSPIREEPDAVVGVLVTVKDSTSRVKRYRTLTEALPQLMWTALPDGSVDYANRQCLEYTGLATEKKYGNGWVATIHPSDLPAVGRAWAASMASGTIFKAEYRIKRFDGGYRWFLGRAVPIKNDRGELQYWIGTATEIEEQKAALGQLERETALREQFVATLTHDLRNPLTSAKLAAQMLKLNGGDPVPPAKVANLSGRIIDSIARANRMIENLLDANRIKAGEPLQLEMREMDLRSLVEETLAELTTLLGDRFRLEAGDADWRGHWNEDGLRRIVENLCSNAVKYGDVSIPVTLGLRRERSSGEVALSVHNGGNPIPADELGSLFDPFKRATTSASSSGKGWGLGLTLVHGFAEAHRGGVRVESSEERGTVFTVTLPSKPDLPA